MGDRVLQFWTVEHGPTMLVAVVLVHVGARRARQASNESQQQGRALLWFDRADLAIPWPFLPCGRGLLPRL